jgi:hypothetical protein
MGTIIGYFHGTHGTTREEVLHLTPDLRKAFGILAEPLSAERTSYAGDRLRVNSLSRIHHPENRELLTAIRTAADKLMGHEALSFLDFR